MIFGYMVLHVFLIRFVRIPYTTFELPYRVNEHFVDSFQYMRARAVVLFAIVLLIWWLTSLVVKESTFKNDIYNKILILMSGTLVVSTLLSPYKEQVLQGSADHYENIWVQIAYIIIAFVIGSAPVYKLNIQTKMAKWFTNICAALIFVCSIIGIFQYFNVNPLEWGLFRWYMVPKALQNQPQLFLNIGWAYSFFGNPNYLGSAFALMLPFVVNGFLISETDKLKYVYLATVLTAHFALLSSMSLGGLLFVPAGVLIVLLMQRSRMDYKRDLASVLIGVLISSVLFIFVAKYQSMAHEVMAVVGLYSIVGILSFLVIKFKVPFKTIGIVVPVVFLAAVITLVTTVDFTSRKNPLTELYVKNNEIHVNREVGSFIVSINDGIISVTDDASNPLTQKADTDDLTTVITQKDYTDVRVEQEMRGGYQTIHLKPYAIDFFISGNEFKFINIGLQEDELAYTKLFMPNIGSLGTARGYIWQSALKLVPEHFFFGSGADTFAIRFPQNDIVNRYNSGMQSYTYIDKAHNMYVQFLVQNGALYLLMFVALIVLCLRKLIHFNNDHNEENRFVVPLIAAIASYAMVGMVNDSKVIVAPIFWIVLGMAISKARQTATQ